MLYFGVCFIRGGFKVTALSQGFAIIDEKLYRIAQAQQFWQWVAEVRTTPDEPAHWFIDENDFDNPDYPTELFHFTNDYDSLFLVNHRALCDMLQFVQEILVLAKFSNSMLNAEFLLASAVRIFQQQFTDPFESEPLLFAGA